MRDRILENREGGRREEGDEIGEKRWSGEERRAAQRKGEGMSKK